MANHSPPRPRDLREDAEQLLELLRGAPIVLFALDREGRFLFGEGRGLARLGLRPNEWAGRSVFEVYAEAPEALEACRRALSGEEFTSLAHAGEFCFETHYAPLLGAGGRRLGTVGVAVDVTEREEALEAVRAGEDRFGVLAEDSVDAIYELDVEGVCYYASPSVANLLGWPAQELVGRNVLRDFIHPEDQEIAVRALAQSLTSGDSQSAEVRFRLPSGGWRWIDAAGRFYETREGQRRALGMIRDVTARRETARAVERELEMQQSLAEISRRFLPLATDEIGPELGRLVEELGGMARAGHVMLLTFGEGRGGDNERFHWQAREETRLHRLDLAWAATKIARGEVVYIESPDELPPEAAAEREAMKRRGVLSSLTLPLLSGAEVIGALTFSSTDRERAWDETDVRWLRLVTDLLAVVLRRRWAEQALEASQSQLLQSQKLEAVGRFAGGIAHDFNNLLTVVLGNAAELLGRDGTEPAQLREIFEAAERAAGLTRRLLAFTRPTPFEEGTLDVNEVVEGLEGMLNRVLGEDVEIHLALSDEPETIRGDRTQLEQVIVNLAVNARDAMPEGGELVIATRDRTLLGRSASRSGVAPGEYVEISVTDTGRGMSDEVRAHALEPFFSTKGPEHGTGLGLSIVYGIVREAGGGLAIASRAGTGTTVRLWFPRRAPEKASEAARATPARGGPETVLLAEDEPAVRRFLQRSLERAGYSVLAAEDGVAALQLAADPDRVIDLLVSDVVMPRLGGPELVERLRGSRPGLRVLLLSGFPERGRGEDAGAVEADGFLQKPFTAESLLARVREVLDS